LCVYFAVATYTKHQCVYNYILLAVRSPGRYIIKILMLWRERWCLDEKKIIDMPWNRWKGNINIMKISRARVMYNIIMYIVQYYYSEDFLIFRLIYTHELIIVGSSTPRANYNCVSVYNIMFTNNDVIMYLNNVCLNKMKVKMLCSLFFFFIINYIPLLFIFYMVNNLNGRYTSTAYCIVIIT